MPANENYRNLRVEKLSPRRMLNADPGVIPVDANAFGTSYPELAGEWWNWALKNPIETNPLFDETGEHCAENQSGKVWFLAGTFGGDASRTCEVPTGKAIFFPILNSVWTPDTPNSPSPGEETLRAAANADIDAVDSLFASVDGQDINAWNYRAESPEGGFTLTFEEGSLVPEEFGVPAGDYVPSVADGYWILLAPLNRGSHTVEFGGSSETGLALTISYELEVVGGHGNGQLTGLLDDVSNSIVDDDRGHIDRVAIDQALVGIYQTETGGQLSNQQVSTEAVYENPTRRSGSLAQNDDLESPFDELVGIVWSEL